MKRWMVTLTFTAQFDAQMQTLIPAEQAHVRELIGQKVVEAIYIASDSSKVWVVMNGENSEEIEQQLALFPLRTYFTFTIISLG